jgi:hypothetical protein
LLKSRKKANAVKLSGIALLTVAVAGIGGTGAVIQHKLAVKNTLKTPTVEVSIDDIVGETEGSKKQKVVSFENQGTADVFIRVAYAEQWEKENELLSSQNSDGHDVAKKFKDTQLENSMENMFPEDEWMLGNDGWYYYRYVLEAANDSDTDQTKPLLTAVDFSNVSSQESEYSGAEYELHFQVEAVQASDDYNLNIKAVDTVFGSGVRLENTQPANWETNKYTSQLEWVEGGN